MFVNHKSNTGNDNSFFLKPAPNVGHRVNPLNMGYVPDGFTEAEYKASKAKEAAKKKESKSFW